jgi:PAS domain S-box-containing protein
VIVDEHGRIALVNSAAERMYGYTRDELVGREVELLMPERFRGRHAFHRTSYASAPSTRPMGPGLELYGLRKDGTEFPMEISLAPIRAKDGMLVYAALRDVSERHRGEHEIEELRRQQELLLSSITEGVLGLDQHGVIRFANAAAAKLLGYHVDELVGKAEHDFLHSKRGDGRDYPADMCPIRRSVQDGTIHHASGEVFLRKAGTSLPVEYTSAPIRERGRIVGASLIFTDVSERSRTEAVLRESQQRVLNVYEGMPDAFFSIDRDWKIAYINPAGERLVGTTKAQLVGRSFWDAAPQSLTDPAVQAEYRRAMEQHASARLEGLSEKLGKWLEATIYPTEEGLSVYLRDITDAKRGEEAVREASIARPLARRIVQDLVEQGGVAHQILTQVGRKLAAETPARTLDDHLASYRDMGLGKLEVEKGDGGRYSFKGSDLLERRPESRVATCSFTLGYLSEAVSHVHGGEPTLGTEIECQSRGASKCRFIVQVKKPEEGLARRVKELI